jgi:hypothetical protein
MVLPTTPTHTAIHAHEVNQPFGRVGHGRALQLRVKSWKHVVEVGQRFVARPVVHHLYSTAEIK